MSRIVFFATLTLLITAVLFGLLWTNCLSAPFLPSNEAEGWAFLFASVGALVGFVYQLYIKAYSKSVPARYLSAPPSHLLPNAIPRTGELQKLRQLLLHSHRPVVVHGVGGLGKTTFAQMYCQQYGGKYTGVAWLYASAAWSNDPNREADNAEYFLRAFTDNQALLDYLAFEPNKEDALYERFQKIIARIGNLPGKYLLVLDNAPEVAARYTSALSSLKNAELLLTSRYAIHNMEPYELDTLSPDKAAQLFCNVYGQRSADPSIDEIIQAYGYHTQTIELLAAYAKEKNLIPIALKKELEERGLLQLENYELRLPTSPKAMTLRAQLLQTFLLELDEKEQEIMRYMSILPSAGALLDPRLRSEEFLCALFDKMEQKVEFHNVLHGLIRLHWLIEKEGEFFCHPVIAETAKAQLIPNVVNCGVLVERVTHLLVPNRITYEPVQKRALFISLGESIFENVLKKDKNFDEADGRTALLADSLGQSFFGAGELRKAFEYKKWVVNIFEKILPSEHPTLATSYNNLAETCRALGEHQQSLAYNQKALAIQEKILPPEHPDFAQTYNSLAVTYEARGEYIKYFECLVKSLTILEKNLSPDLNYLATLYNNLGGACMVLGKYQQSLMYSQKALAIWEKILPPEHPDLATPYNNLAEIYQALDEHHQCLTYHKKALAIREKTLPSEHPDLGLSYNNLAEAYGILGEHQQRLAYHQKALAIWEKTLPPEHPDLAQSYNNLALTYGDLGNHHQSLAYNQKALAIREKILSTEHPDLAQSYNNLSIAYYNLKDLNKAIGLMCRAVAIWEKSLPTGHPNTVKAKNSLAFLEEELSQAKRD